MIYKSIYILLCFKSSAFLIYEHKNDTIYFFYEFILFGAIRQPVEAIENYSYRRASTGFLTAALYTCEPIVSMAVDSTTKAASTKGKAPNGTWYSWYAPVKSSLRNTYPTGIGTSVDTARSMTRRRVIKPAICTTEAPSTL